MVIGPLVIVETIVKVPYGHLELSADILIYIGGEMGGVRDHR